MGQQSQHNKPPNEAARERGGRAKTTHNNMKKAGDSGTHQKDPPCQPLKPCTTCTKIAARKLDPSLPEWKKSHANYCPESNIQKSIRKRQEQEKAAKEMQRCLNTLTTTAAGTTDAATTAVADPSTTTTESTTKTTEHSLSAHSRPAKQITLDGSKMDNKLSRETLKKVIKERMGKFADRETAEGRRPTPQLSAVIDYVINELLPGNYHNGTNKRRSGPVTDKRAEWLNYYLDSGDGMVCLEIPRQDHRHVRDPDCAMVEGIRLYFSCWELIKDGLELDCPKDDCSGKLIRLRWTFTCERGIAPGVHLSF